MGMKCLKCDGYDPKEYASECEDMYNANPLRCEKTPEQYCDNCTKQGNYDTFQCPGTKCIPERDFVPKPPEPHKINTSQPLYPELPNAGGIAYFNGIEWYAKSFVERKENELIAEFIDSIDAKIILLLATIGDHEKEVEVLETLKSYWEEKGQ